MVDSSGSTNLSKKDESLDTQKSSVFVTKDYITLAISIFALIISFLSFYFLNVRINDSLFARVINIDMSGRKDSTWKNDVGIELALINAGNREATILSPRLWLSEKMDGNETAINLRTDNSCPFVLEPHQTKIINLRLNFEEINSVKGKLIKVEERNWINGSHIRPFISINIYRRYGLIEYSALDSKGDKHIVRTKYIFEMRTLDNIINLVTNADKADSNGYKSTKIF